jgi:NADH-quinone oxidoreductase subunit F
MEFIPHLLIEGMITSSFALVQTYPTSWRNMWVYKNPGRALRSESCRLVGKHIRNGIRLRTILFTLVLAPTFVVKKPHLLNHWKGKERPSYQAIPCSFRFMVKSTVVNNVETIASVPWIVNNSGDDYAKLESEDLLEPN